MLKITPGDYREKITVTKPGVTFANADVTAKRAVTIRASYYSSNTFDADGKFLCRRMNSTLAPTSAPP